MNTNYHAYGANGVTIKDGAVTVEDMADEDAMASALMDAVAEDIGEDRFEREVVGVAYGRPVENSIRNRLAVKERQLTGLLLLKGTQHPETLRIRDEVMALENELEEIRK